ncbi:thiamine pyrophosphate-dependent enzyme [Methanoplanus endosymbiosus]|uniref:Thiamine pyrophosphate-dependent enzyme n=1 Tax=Methanoplanus endosymbiosus TaxID=33865 RepID=A0A9E7PNZ3_9EURY|nr:thiamine pyrophosphate-dependent enzyme [Methanoplanus endosymbiosus]UUX92807.1 thiamine pyrophosphate-dependent enzyme [Methanoplanus endosymbiosus]
MVKNLITSEQNTWCMGCGNFSVEHSLKEVFAGMRDDSKSLDEVVLVAGIGCHGKIADYLNVNSVYSLHGRAIPFATGIKLADNNLKVICCVGDGDAYAEGLEHLIFAAKRNIDITVIVHDNRVYGLTTGQYTPTSPYHFKGRSTPGGSPERPVNPLSLMLVSGATYIARSYSGRKEHLAGIIRAGIEHKGFSYIEVLQICASYCDMTDSYEEKTEIRNNENLTSYSGAEEIINIWNYDNGKEIPLGEFYQVNKSAYEDEFSPVSDVNSGKTSVTEFLDGI